MGVARRFVKFGGAVGGAQMAWLRAELCEADGLGEHVIVCCHLVQPGLAECGGRLGHILKECQRRPVMMRIALSVWTRLLKSGVAGLGKCSCSALAHGVRQVKRAHKGCVSYAALVRMQAASGREQ